MGKEALHTNPHRSLTHVAIARTNDTEHNRRPSPCVFLCSSHSSRYSLVCSIPAKSYPANRIWQIMHGFVPDYKFLMPTLPPPSSLLNKPNFRSGMLMTESTRKDDLSSTCHGNEDGPAMIYQDDPPFCSEGFLIGGAPT